MSDQGSRAQPANERPGASMHHLAGVSPAARKVAGARRNPSVVGFEETSPAWLRTAAGWSWRLLVVVAGIALVFYATSRVQLLFIAIFLACVFTAVLRPLVDLLNKFMPRALAVVLGMLSAFAFFAGLITYVVSSVASQWESLSKQFSTGINQVINFVEHGPLPVTVTSGTVNQWIENGREWLQTHSGELAGQAASSAGSVVQIFTVLALATFCTVFFLAKGDDMWTWFLNQLPARSRDNWKTAGGVGWYTFSGYARGTVIIAVTDAILAAIILIIVGVPLAAPLAVLVFIGAFIPLVGAPAAMVIAMVVALAANGVVKAIIVGVGIALVGQFEGHILQPLVMGKQVSLHPVVVALGVTAGTLVAGILGAVISVPLIAVAWAVFSRLRRVDPPMEEQDSDDEDEDEDEELVTEG
jgi:predicted PurR-regulated permease PerM